MSKKLFSFAVGNPPYQDETIGDNKGFAPPVYDKFLDAAAEVANCVELIHPARFLFNAGSTPKAWNNKMLHDPHFKVLHYEEDASKIFPNTDIKGGVAITYRNSDENYGAIEIFTPYEELNNILHRVLPLLNGKPLATIGVSGYSYHFTEKMHIDNPELKKETIVENGKTKPLLSKGHEYDLKSNVIGKIPQIFHESRPNDGNDYVIIVGRTNNKRVNRYIRADYINEVSNLYKFKVFIPKASGIGAFGEVLGPSIVAEPSMGHTETFFSIGLFDTKEEADNLLKYLKGKFSRTLLSILKKTQNITPGNFSYVPLEDFTSKSDIDWSKSIHDIDLQLYRKYGLSAKEIAFIEKNVKEME